MIVSLDQSLLGQKSPWTNVFLGLMSPWTNVYLDNSVLGLLSLGQTVTWTTAPWTNVSTPEEVEDVSEANIVVSEASKLSAGAKILRGP